MYVVLLRPWISSPKQTISEQTLDGIFSETLTDTPCVYLNEEREVHVATEMCVQYLESIVDSIVIRNNELKPIGMLGGYDLLNFLRLNPSRDAQYDTKVNQIMSKNLLFVNKTTFFEDLMKKWTESRRAFAIVPNKFQGHSPISARKFLDVGIRCKTNTRISSLPKKKMITFHSDDTLRDIINLMFENKTRKLVLEYSNQFISDRIILKEISKTLKIHPNVTDFLEIPASQIQLEDVEVEKEDLLLNQICEKMLQMDHPYVIYKDISITPWDICNVLMNERLAESYELKSDNIVCPHCKKEFDTNQMLN